MLDSTVKTAAPDERLIKLPEILNTTKLCRTKWLDLVKRKKAPQPIKIGRGTFWVYSEVQAFVAEVIRQARVGA